MGSGRDKRKKAKPRKPGQGADKTVKKTEANEEKASRRTERRTKVRHAPELFVAGFKVQPRPLFTA